VKDCTVIVHPCAFIFEHEEHTQQQEVAVLNCRVWVKIYVRSVSWQFSCSLMVYSQEYIVKS